MKSILVLITILVWLPVKAYAEHDIFNKVGVVPPKTSQPAPDFVVKNLKGQDVMLSDFNGKVS